MRAGRGPSRLGPLSRPPGCGRGPAAARPSPAPPAGPPGRLAARQGVGVHRSFRAAAAVPSWAVGRPLPARGLGWLGPSLCAGLPLGPVGPAPPRPPWARLLRAGGPVPARRSLAGLATLARLALPGRLRRARPGARPLVVVSLPAFCRRVGPGAWLPWSPCGHTATVDQGNRSSPVTGPSGPQQATKCRIGGSIMQKSGPLRPRSTRSWPPGCRLHSQKCQIGRPSRPADEGKREAHGAARPYLDNIETPKAQNQPKKDNN